MKIFSSCFALLCLFSNLFAQTQEVLFPDLEGDALLGTVVSEYKTNTVLSYEEAREYLYQVVYNEDDYVTCVYTGHSLYLPPSQNNPIFHLSNFGSINGIITEHTYPQSKGAGEGNPKSDMHHLVPARLGANVARLNFPFGEIDDENTSTWLINDSATSTIPTNNIDEYSEQRIGMFEPKEDQKGNTARMIFYFYTMYEAEALAEDPDFFEEQKAALCDWHFQDEVDENEYERTFLIAEQQNGLPNPFILDCTLAARTYCPDHPNACDLTATKEETAANIQLTIAPNPAANQAEISFQLSQKSQVNLAVFDVTGRKILSLVDSDLSGGNYVYQVDVSSLRHQLLFTRLSISNENGTIQVSEKLVVK